MTRAVGSRAVAPVGGAAAWRGADLADDRSWCHVLAPEDLGATVAWVREAAGAVREGRLALAEVVAPPTPEVAALAASVRRDLVDGRGFALVRGLPVGDLDDVERQVLYWHLGTQIGVPLRQNAAGDVLVRVRDEGRSFEQLEVRAYETTAALDYHTDSADVVGLLCVRPARSGGTSTIVGSAAVHDEMVRRRPDLAALLYEPWPQVNPVDGAITHGPICARSASGHLYTRYGRRYTERAAADPSVPDLTERQVAALDLFDELTRDPGFVLDMEFRPGDVQFLNNHAVLHARTGYVDFDERERRRELLRMWLVLSEGVDVPPAFADAGFVPRREAFERGPA